MTTDPTAVHHAQILDWLSAALTDPDTTMIYLHQDTDEAGTWEIHADRKVDTAREATAASRADEATLYRMDGDYAPPAWVDEATMDPSPPPYDRGGLPGFSGTIGLDGDDDPTDPGLECQCAVCEDERRRVVDLGTNTTGTPFRPLGDVSDAFLKSVFGADWWEVVQKARRDRIRRDVIEALYGPNTDGMDRR